RHGEKIILHKNDDYYENADQMKQVPQTDAIAISFITDKQSEFMEFMLEKIDFISGINPQFKDALLTRTGELREKHKSKIYLQKSPYLNTEYLGFNLDSGKSKVVPPAVRKAINYCFNREEMVMYMRNNMADQAGKGIVPPSLNQTYSHQLSGYSFDRDYARQLLAEHGFADGYPSTIDLHTTSDYVDICEYIQHSAAQIGIDIKIHLATGASFRNMIANGEAQMFRASWIADYPNAENYLSLFYSPNKSPQGPNYTRFSHTAYDSLYRKALNETNHEKQAAIYHQMESIIIANAPIVPLYYDNVVRFVNNRIKNFPTNPLNLLEVKNVEIQE
ncbi:MAG: ABC transporter substrate-binding protein, partial [Salinivirgaceae bacterium]